MDLFKTNGQLKARGKLLADLQDWRTQEALELWNSIEHTEDDMFEAPIVTEEELDVYLKTRYREIRQAEYPSPTDYLDAIVKGDTVAQKAYIDACLAVKAKYPK
jgi:predicted nucleic acid-binding protein